MACPLIYPQLTRSIPDIVAKASRFFQLPLRMTACPLRRLDRIVVRWNRAAVPSDHVNPIYFKRVEQIRVGGSPRAIPSDPDLDRKSTRLHSSHSCAPRMPSSA